MNAAQPLKLLTTADPEALRPKEWLVPDLLGAAEVSALIAPAYAGKSLLAISLAAAVPLGCAWFGRVPTKGAALYLAPERHRVTLRRLRAIEIWHEEKLVNVAVVGERINLLDPEDVKRIVAAARQHEDKTGCQVRLLTIDTVQQSMIGADENSGKDMSNYLDAVARLRDRTGAHVQLIHHTPLRDLRRGRGHTSLAGMTDATMIVVQEKDGTRRWSLEAANDLPEQRLTGAFILHSVNLGTGEAPVVVPVAEEANAKLERQAVLSIVAEHPGGITMAKASKLGWHRCFP